jgi:restriction system protein
MMPIPTLFDLTLPVLELAAEGEVSYAECASRLADPFGVTPEEQQELLASGNQTRWENRLRWAKVELGLAGLVENTRPKHFRATKAGRDLLAQNPPPLDRSFLLTIPAYAEAMARSKAKAKITSSALPDGVSPAPEHGTPPGERIDAALTDAETALAQQLVESLQAAPPVFFERAILAVMIGMGYGRSIEEAASHVGGPGDEGIDGIIDGDPLGLDRVYLQAKRYGRDKAVSAEEVRAFLGSLVAKGASKGVLMTTSRFTQAAIEFARSLPYRVVLVDGPTLADLMIRYDVGVRAERQIVLKKIDEDFFGEGE